jgi:gluconate 2-dehydrogenase alpha chain
MTTTLPTTDVVIIGLGAAGGVASYVLTQAGLHVVGLEAGPRLDATNFLERFDELGEGAFTRNSMGGPKFNREIPTWRPNIQTPTISSPPTVGMANAVGGSSVHYGAQSWRFLESDFTIRSSTIERYGAAALPAGYLIADWPVTYAELEPYYDNIEWYLGVSGQGGANPFEAPRTRGYPMPALRPAGYPALMGDVEKKLGYHPFPQPAAITSEEFNGRPGCSFCGFCGDGFGCWNNAKSSTLVTTIPAAEKTGLLEVRPNSRVMEILTNSNGAVTAVQYLDATGQSVVQPARFVILSTYIYENNRQLLLAKSKYYPNGLCNNTGQVGKYYRPQVTVSVNGLYPGKPLNLWTGTSGQTVCFDDLNGDNFDHKGLGFIRGASIQIGTNNLPISQSKSVPPNVPMWGSAYKQWLNENANSVGSFLAQMETLPYEANFIDLDPVKKDDLGVPVLRLTFNAYENEVKMAAYLTEKMNEIHKAAGATEVWGGPAPSVVPVYSHAYGGTLMGNDPGTSVVNQYSIAHEAPNLAIMGGSTFVTTTGYNPTEMIEALAWYGAEYIGKNFDSLAVS